MRITSKQGVYVHVPCVYCIEILAKFLFIVQVADPDVLKSIDRAIAAINEQATISGNNYTPQQKQNLTYVETSLTCIYIEKGEIHKKWKMKTFGMLLFKETRLF